MPANQAGRDPIASPLRAHPARTINRAKTEGSQQVPTIANVRALPGMREIIAKRRDARLVQMVKAARMVAHPRACLGANRTRQQQIAAVLAHEEKVAQTARMGSVSGIVQRPMASSSERMIAPCRIK